MKVLLAVYAHGEGVYTEVVEFLEGKGCEVTIFSLFCGLMDFDDPTIYEFRDNRSSVVSSAQAVNGKMVGGEEIIERFVGYDVIVWALHTREVFGTWLCDRINPRLGHIVMEHDLLSPNPEMGKLEGSLGVVAFHNKHYRQTKGAGFKTVLARWCKLDCHYPVYNVHAANTWNDAVLLGTTSPPTVKLMRKDAPFEFSNLFRRVWYKPYCPRDPEKKGTERLPIVFEGPRGTKFCADLAKFHFLVAGSSYADALLFGALPIVYRRPDIVRRAKRVDDIMSLVNWQALRPGLAVTDHDLPRKIEMLRDDKDLFNQTIERLKAEFVSEGYEDCPTAGQAVWSLIEDA